MRFGSKEWLHYGCTGNDNHGGLRWSCCLIHGCLTRRTSSFLHVHDTGNKKARCRQSSVTRPAKTLRSSAYQNSSESTKFKINSLHNQLSNMILIHFRLPRVEEHFSDVKTTRRDITTYSEWKKACRRIFRPFGSWKQTLNKVKKCHERHPQLAVGIPRKFWSHKKIQTSKFTKHTAFLKLI